MNDQMKGQEFGFRNSAKGRVRSASKKSGGRVALAEHSVTRHRFGACRGAAGSGGVGGVECVLELRRSGRERLW